MPARFVKEIVGYANPLSVRAGDAVNICISCDAPGEYDATLVRLISGDARPHGTGFREIAVESSLRGRYTAEQQPLLPGSYAVLPDLPATDSPTIAFYLYPTLLEPRDQTVIRGGDFRVAVNASGIVVVIGNSRVEVTAALLERRWYRIAVAIGASIEVQIDGVPTASSERPIKSRTTHRLPHRPSIPRGDWELAREAPGTGHFNGRIEAVRIYGGGDRYRSCVRRRRGDAPCPAGDARCLGLRDRHRDQCRNRRFRAWPARHSASDSNTRGEGRALARRRVQLARRSVAVRRNPLSRRRPHRRRLASQHPLDRSGRPAVGRVRREAHVRRKRRLRDLLRRSSTGSTTRAGGAARIDRHVPRVCEPASWLFERRLRATRTALCERSVSGGASRSGAFALRSPSRRQWRAFLLAIASRCST